MVNEEDLDYDNFEKVEADINGVVVYTYRKGDRDYLILEVDGGDYPLHYITFATIVTNPAPFKK